MSSLGAENHAVIDTYKHMADYSSAGLSPRKNDNNRKAQTNNSISLVAKVSDTGSYWILHKTP